MNVKILITKPSKRPLWETMLAEDGPMTPNMPIGEQVVDLLNSYELRIEIFTLGMVPDKVIIVEKNHYQTIFQKYSMDDLKAGIKIESIFDVMQPIELDSEVVLEEEIDILTKKIIDELPFLIRGIDYTKYPPTDLEFFIKQQILNLKNKFKIQPK